MNQKTIVKAVVFMTLGLGGITRGQTLAVHNSDQAAPSPAAATVMLDAEAHLSRNLVLAKTQHETLTRLIADSDPRNWEILRVKAQANLETASGELQILEAALLTNPSSIALIHKLNQWEVRCADFRSEARQLRARELEALSIPPESRESMRKRLELAQRNIEAAQIALDEARRKRESAETDRRSQELLKQAAKLGSDLVVKDLPPQPQPQPQQQQPKRQQQQQGQNRQTGNTASKKGGH